MFRKDFFMDLKLKLLRSENLENEDWLDLIDDGEVCRVKLTTNYFTPEVDRQDQRYLKALRNTKMIINLDEGCLILFGNLEVSFQHPMGGQYYCQKIIYDSLCDFDTTDGVDSNVLFTGYPNSIDEMRIKLDQISNDDRFEFNISQFEDFMEIFTYYKQISDELNNSASFLINSFSRPYYFLSTKEKKIYGLDGELLEEYRFFEEVYDLNGKLLGYKVEDYSYELMSNSLKESIEEVIDIRIDAQDNNLSKTKKMINDLYISNYKEITNKNQKEVVGLSVLNIKKDKKEIVITVLKEEKMDCKYINLYDMGQKIKIDSIEESLRLIKQGNSGSAIQLLSYLIGDKEIPRDSSGTNSTKRKYTENLNVTQEKAFLKAIDSSPVTLIKGPPGTGKTHVINAITQYITKELNEKVVISSQTHIAIDNVLDKLMENYDLIIPNRITNKRNRYSGNEIDKTIFKTWGAKFKSHNNRAKNTILAKKIEEQMNKFRGQEKFTFSEHMEESDYSVIGATTTTSAIAGKKGTELLKDYKWLIIDEVSKCPITEVLRYLPYIEKIIMVGDDYQLAPLLEFTKDQIQDLAIYNEEKFERLKGVYQKSVFAETMNKARKADRLVELDINYRSVPNVLAAYNVFYDNMLKSERMNIKPQTVQFKEEMKYLNEKDIAFMYVKGGKEVSDKNSTSRYNVEELEATKDMLKQLIKYTENPSQVTVSAIFPYAAQISKFTDENREIINTAIKTFRTFDVDTVDAFQGKESDIILVNTVITDLSKKNFLSDFRRINVSMSRAKDKLIIFGNQIVLSKLDMNVNDGSKRKYFKEIIDICKRQGLMMEYTNERGIQIESKSKSETKIKKAK